MSLKSKCHFINKIVPIRKNISRTKMIFGGQSRTQGEVKIMSSLIQEVNPINRVQKRELSMRDQEVRL